MNILGIETSCDETAAAIVCGGEIISNVVSSQIPIHKEFGGVIPEYASRYHLSFIDSVVKEAIDKAGVKIDKIAVTKGPGLKGSLLIGSLFARLMGFSLDIPVVGVNHLKAHLLSAFIGQKKVAYPFVGLLVSGGHTFLIYAAKKGSFEILGQTIDDAVGEAYDKVASILNLGYPGGPIIDKLSKDGDPKAFTFPRSMIREQHFNFSFSGLKTAVLYQAVGARDLKKVKGVKSMLQQEKADIAASFQEAVIDVLVKKSQRALRHKKATRLVLAGGVACNSALRTKMSDMAKREGVEFVMPQMCYCTDNAAMIAYSAYALSEKKINWKTEPNLKLV